ncbi:hypothetical protein [Streptomyces sp. NPDC093544]|uniref:hypothetical protein n=1 Tax=Streptomyces sp. NPDC093544 TaxID=3155200 RepID=UPI00342C93CE
MRAKRILALVGTPVAAVGLLLTAGSPALAVDHEMHTDDSDPGGRVQFTAGGDIVRVDDLEADGYAAKLVVYNPNGTTRYTIQAGSAGTSKTVRASDGGAYDLTEDTAYKFTICLHKTSGDSYCDTAVWAG